jgi:hypothetical protein
VYQLVGHAKSFILDSKSIEASAFLVNSGSCLKQRFWGYGVYSYHHPLVSSITSEDFMITVEQIDTKSKAQVKEFVQFHYDLYKGTPQWVPPFYSDINLMLNKEKHPFFEHSEGEFFIARNGKEMVGRLAILENKPFNKYHDCKKAQFYLFDSQDDVAIPNALFDRAFEWCKQRNLEAVVGPKGLGAFDGYGIQTEGFEHRQMMNMMNYNFAYYPGLFEKMGFARENDFVSAYIDRKVFNLPEKFEEVAKRVRERGKFKIVNFTSKSHLLKWAQRIGEAYNKTFVNNWEYYPLSEREVKFVVDNLMVVAVPELIKIITYNDEVVGFLLGFPDISAAMQRHGGHLTPWALADFMIELKRSRFISLNGVGVLPEYHGRGGNTLLYSEMKKVLVDSRYDEGELTQMADTATQVRKDVITAGARIWKNHRIYAKHV